MGDVDVGGVEKVEEGNKGGGTFFSVAATEEEGWEKEKEKNLKRSE